jgi:hypothetical protein
MKPGDPQLKVAKKKASKKQLTLFSLKRIAIFIDTP